VLEEFLEVEALGYDDQGRLFEQLNHYALELPEVLNERPFWTGVLLRDHRDPKVRNMLDIWLAHVQRYSRRDQLSVNVAFRRAGLRPEVLRIDNHESWFHSWPNRISLRRASVLRLASPFLSHPAARAKEIARDNAANHARVAELETALASEQSRTAELTQAVAAERSRTAELTQAVAAEPGRAARTHVEHSIVVVIPLCDGATYIKRAIESVFAQTIQPAEIVVVDDGSGDDGPEIVMALPQAEKITLLRKSNGGQSSARNFGVKSSKSSLIAFLDQDDLWYPRHLEVLSRLIGRLTSSRWDGCIPIWTRSMGMGI
jgi:hypothetical protein